MASPFEIEYERIYIERRHDMAKQANAELEFQSSEYAREMAHISHGGGRSEHANEVRAEVIRGRIRSETGHGLPKKRG